jgi:poly-gamma-glutamate capsule biosynthesis protein CapA/YwtB (metallophosphatase superfamily)
VVLAGLLAIVLGVVLLTVRPWAAGPGEDAGADPAPLAAAEPDAGSDGSANPAASPERVADAVFTIVAGGDVLPHDTVIRNARTASGYDFVPLMAAVQDWIAGGDLAICNLEVPLAPPGTSPSGYPMFGAPTELAADLAKLGWDGCATGTNHTLDRRYAGVVHTLDSMDAAGLGHAGSARSAEEADTPQLYLLERGGQEITVAQIAATYGTNGIPIPDEAPWAVTLIDPSRLIAQAAAAREAGADLVVASLHWGQEYQATPTDDQVRVAEALAESGQVDLVIGNHAHVPQPMARLDGGPRGEGMWVAYGLGNFLSNQDTHCCIAQTNTGAFMTATVVKSADGPARVERLEWTAFPVDRLGGQRVYTAQDILDGSLPEGLQFGANEAEARRQRVAEVMGAEATERTEPPAPTGPEPSVVPRAS